jgi:hypothetical protein
MKVFICCSKAFYSYIPPIKKKLEAAGHVITLPNSYDNPTKELEMHAVGAKEHSEWKASMLRLQIQKIQGNDAILVLNFEKNGQQNYIGGATFLEMFKAFELGKKLYLFNEIPDGILRDEILAFNPTLIHQDLTLVK